MQPWARLRCPAERWCAEHWLETQAEQRCRRCYPQGRVLSLTWLQQLDAPMLRVEIMKVGRTWLFIGDCLCTDWINRVITND